MKEFALVQKASRTLLDEEKMNEVLTDLANSLIQNSTQILEANKKDLERMDPQDPKYDRLLLNEERIQGIAADMKNVATLPCPLGEILEEKTTENGLELKKVRVPLGVIGVIYEARPNVTFDVFSLCFKAGNACILKGSSDAKDSNEAAVALIHEVLKKHGVDPNVVFLMPPEREHVKTLLEAKEFVDIIIPRGSQGLIDFVTENSKVPTIETGAGIVHTYVDKSADLEMAKNVIHNAKTRRVSVCNALDTLILHKDLLPHLEELLAPLKEAGVEVFQDEEHYGTEFLSMKMSVKIVDSVQEAVEHITEYGSKHSEAIIAEDQEAADYFLKNVDASSVYHNTSTAFTDGAQFGLGAEIGISTQKLHARGPMSLREITSYKWLIKGSGQTRPA
jgi:glutamate-5-semialdehyde dehydrogenase